MGVRGVANNLIKSYWINRYQYTVCNDSINKRALIELGIPQGSVLGPLLYLLYVHSLKYAGLYARYYMFADDTTLVYTGSKLIWYAELHKSWPWVGVS